MLVMETNEPTPTTEAAESGTPVAARRKPRKLVVALTALAILLCVLAAAFFAYASDSYHDLDANHRNLVSTETLPVQQGDNYLALATRTQPSASCSTPARRWNTARTRRSCAIWPSAATWP